MPDEQEISSGTTEIDINAVEQTGVIGTPDVGELNTVPASALFGEGAVEKSIEDETRKIGGNQPKRDETTGKFLPKTSAKTSAKPASPAPAKPASPAKQSTPAAPVKPVASAKPATPEVPPKIKVGGKEYTEDELAALLAPKPAQAQQLPPAVPQPQEPTAEQIAGLEKEWIEQNAAEITTATVSEALLDTIVLGGKEGAKALETLLKQVAAHGVLLARKSMFGDLNPVLDELRQAVVPVQQQFVQMERVAAQHEFFATYPEFSESDQDKAFVQEVAETLMTKYPEWTAKLPAGPAGRKAFLAEVARQADMIKQSEFKRWFPSHPGTWKDHQREQKAAAQQQSVATPAVAPAAPTTPRVRPPGANAPSPSPSLGSSEKDFQRSVAAALANG